MFCVYLTIYSGNQLPPFYIGSTSIKRIVAGYRGSVKSKKYREIWKRELKKAPQLFRSIILSQHATRQEALDKEEKLQLMVRAHINPLYTNQSTARGKFGLICRGNPGRRSEQTKRNISIGRKGKCLGQRPPEVGQKISQVLKGHSVKSVTRQKLREHNLGKTMSEEARKKISEFQKGRKKKPEAHAKAWATRRLRATQSEQFSD